MAISSNKAFEAAKIVRDYCKERLRLFARNYCPNCGAKMDGDGNG